MQELAVLGLEIDSTRMVAGAAQAKTVMRELTTETNVLSGALTRAQTAFRTGIGFLGIGFGLFEGARAIKQAIDLAARYETLGIVLTRVGQSAGYSSGFLTQLTRDLEKTGISMKESRQTIISMIQSQLELGNATKLARLAQDAAVTAGLNSSATLQRIVYGVTSSQVEILRSVGLNVSWEQSYKDLARELGKTQEQLTNQERVTARVNAVMKAGIPITGAYEASMTTAGKQVKSMERYAEDLKTKLGLVFQPAYTATVFAFSEAMKLTSGNVELLVPLLAVYLARLVAMKVANTDMVTGLRQRIALEVQHHKAVMDGSAVALNSRTADKQRAEQSLKTAQATRAEIAAEVELLTVRRNARLREFRSLSRDYNITAGDRTGLRDEIARNRDRVQREMGREQLALTAATERLAVADAHLAGAQNTVAATGGRVTMMMRAQSVAAGVLATAGRVVAGAWAFLGGAWGVALTAGLVIMSKMATQTSAVKEVADRYTDAMDVQRKKSEALTAQLDEQARAYGRVAASSTGSTGQLIRDLDKSRQMLGEAARGIGDYSGLEGKDYEQTRAIARELTSLTRAYQAGTLGVEQFYTKLAVMSQRHRSAGATEWIATFSDALMANAAVSAEWEERQKKVQAALTGTATAGQAAGAVLSKAAREMKEELENQRAVLAARQGGGDAAAAVVERQQAAFNKAKSAFKEYANTQQQAAVQTLEFRDALKLTDEQIHNLAVGAAAGQRGSANWGNNVKDGINALVAARTEAKLLMDIANQIGAAQYQAQQAAAAEGRRRQIEDLRIEVTNTERLIAVAGESVAVRQRLEQSIRAEAAARGLGKEASDAERQSIAATTRALAEREAVLARSRELADVRQQINDSQRLAVAYSQGEQAAAAMHRQLEREAAARDRLVGATSAELLTLEMLNQAKAREAAVRDVAALEREVQAAEGMARALEQGAKEGVAAARMQEVLNRVRAAGVIGLEAMNLALQTYILLTRKATAEDQQAAVQRGRAEAERRGEEYKRELERGSDEASQPFKNAVRSIQGELGRMFSTLLKDGKSAFQRLGDMFKETLLRAVGEVLAAAVMKKLISLWNNLGSGGRQSPVGALAALVGFPVGAGANGGAQGQTAGLAGGLGIGRDAFGGLLAGGVVGYGIGSMAGSRGMGAVGGALGGAAAGFAAGGPIGAVVGGVTGLVTGLMGAGAKAREAAQLMAKAKEQFAKNMDDYVAVANGTNTQLRQNLRRNEEQVRELVRQGVDGGGAWRSYQGVLRAFGAQGTTDAAVKAQVELFQKPWKEIEATLKAGGPYLYAQRDAFKAVYDQMQPLLAANKDYITQLHAEEQARRTGMKGDLDVRRLQALGRDKEAEALRLQLQQAEELRRATQEWGKSNPELIAQLKEVQALEKDKAAKELARANRGNINVPGVFRIEDYVYRSMRAHGSPSFADNPGAMPQNPAAVTAGGAAASGGTATDDGRIIVHNEYHEGAVQINAQDRTVQDAVDEHSREEARRLKSEGSYTHSSRMNIR